jgi:hypothetical protein
MTREKCAWRAKKGPARASQSPWGGSFDADLSISKTVDSSGFYFYDPFFSILLVLSCVNKRNYSVSWKGGALAPPVRRSRLKGPLGPEATRLQGLKPRGVAGFLRRG